MARRARHAMPDDIAKALSKAGLKDAYDDRPAYQRNDYLGWIGQAKKDETRDKRVKQMLSELKAGDVYMKMAWTGGDAEDRPGA